MNRLAPLTLLLLAGFTGACTSKRTELVVLVDSNLTVPSQLSSVVAHVKPADGGTQVDRTFMLGTLPLSFGVLPPGGNSSRKVDVVVEGVDPSGKTIVSRHAITGFIDGETLLLDMFLDGACAGKNTCTNDQTCTEHGCASVVIDPSSLPVVNPGDELHVDAGAGRSDGGRQDSGPDAQGKPDAGDGGPPGDVGPSDAQDVGPSDAADVGPHDGGDAGDIGPHDAAPDAMPSDTMPSDALPDAGLDAADTGTLDAVPDTGADDGPPDTGIEDALPDTGIQDATPDTGIQDAAPDAGFPAVSLDFSTSAQSIAAGSCSFAATVERRDANNSLVTTGVTPLILGASPGSISFFSDPACGTVLTGFQIPDGQSSATFYFLATAANSYALTVSANGLSSASQTEIVYPGQAAALQFITPPRTITAGGCSAGLTLERLDAFNNPTGTGMITVNLSASDIVTTVFFANGVCSAPSITQVTFGPGQVTIDSFFSATAAGTDVVSASSAGIPTATQNETVVAAAPHQIAVITPARGPYAEECSLAPVTVQAQDSFANPSPVASDTAVSLTSDSATLAFYPDNLGITPIGQVTITAGTTNANIHFADPTAGTPTLNLQTTSLGITSQQQTVHPAICSSSSWCFGFPMIQGDALHGAFGTDPSHFWAVGDGGQILFNSGTVWARQESGTTTDLFGVWASSPSSVFAVGRGGTILHNALTGWVPESSPTTLDLLALWGTSDTDLWAVGQNGIIIHRTSTGWGIVASTPAVTTNIHAITGFSTTSAFAVGDAGTILELSVNGWSASTNGIVNYFGVFGVNPSDVWAGGDNGSASHFDGLAWSSPFATGLSAVRGFWGPLTNDIWAIGGGGPSGDDGRMARWNGTAFVPHDPSGGGTVGSVMNAVSVGGGFGFAVGDHNVIAVYDAARDRWLNDFINPPGDTIFGLFGASGSDVWAVGGSGEVLRYNGTDWWRDSGIVTNTITLNSVFGFATNNVWMVGSSAAIYHWDGATLSAQSSPFSGATTLEALWGPFPNDLFVAGTQGLIAIWNGTGWTAFSNTGNTHWRAIHGTSIGDIWVAGENGATRHYTGTVWIPVVTPGGTPTLRGIFAAGQNDVWAVGDAGTVLHYNGLWSRIAGVPNVDLRAITGANGTIIAVGANGSIFSVSLNGVVQAVSGTGYTLEAVSILPTGTVLTAGGNEIILHSP